MTQNCPRCDAPLDADQKLCPVCLFNEALKDDTVDCQKCHAPLDPADRFCSECGAMAAQPASAGDPIRAALAEKLASQYRILRMLGRGGMGSVYLARDLTLDREVAIKVVNGAAGSRTVYERFRREAKTAAKLSHPNIVPLHSFGEVSGMPYFVMGYVRGESLADRLRRDGKLPEEEARRIMAQIAGALDHAHRQGVIHRDVKPDNVLLEDESGRALLMDFGVAKAVEKGEMLTQQGSVIGTPQYMSPEQASGQSAIDGRSDIYSLGILGWAIVAGRLPFEGDTPADILKKHLVEHPPALRSVAPDVSDALAQVIERCLAKAPEDRWSDARSLSRAVAIDEENNLPDALKTVESSGVPGLLIAWALGIFYAALMRSHALERAPSRAAADFTDVYFINAWFFLLAVIAYVFVVIRLRRQGFAPAVTQRIIWKEPAWWLWWYPRELRRGGNVWERLPARVRALRWSIAFFAFFLCVGWTTASYFGMARIYSRTGGGYHPFARLLFVVFLLTVAAWFLFTILARRELRRKGLFEEDVNRVMMSVPPSRNGFWARPHIAAILAPAAERSLRLADSPHDQIQAILRQADDLSGPFRPLGAQAAAAARQLVASIEYLDREIAELSRNLDPGEDERLAGKIEVLAASSTSSEASAPLISLLEQQLDLIRSLSARMEEAQQKRSRRLAMLRNLSLHLGSLHARQQPTPSELREISDEVRSLCDEIEQKTESLGETTVMPQACETTIEKV